MVLGVWVGLRGAGLLSGCHAPAPPAAPGIPCDLASLARVPLRFAKGKSVDAFNSPFGGIFVRRGVVEGSPRLLGSRAKVRL